MFCLLDGCRLADKYLEGMCNDPASKYGLQDVSVAVSRCSTGKILPLNVIRYVSFENYLQITTYFHTFIE